MNNKKDIAENKIEKYVSIKKLSTYILLKSESSKKNEDINFSYTRSWKLRLKENQKVLFILFI